MDNSPGNALLPVNYCTSHDGQDIVYLHAWHNQMQLDVIENAIMDMERVIIPNLFRAGLMSWCALVIEEVTRSSKRHSMMQWKSGIKWFTGSAIYVVLSLGSCYGTYNTLSPWPLMLSLLTQGGLWSLLCNDRQQRTRLWSLQSSPLGKTLQDLPKTYVQSELKLTKIKIFKALFEHQDK